MGKEQDKALLQSAGEIDKKPVKEELWGLLACFSLCILARDGAHILHILVGLATSICREFFGGFGW